MFEQLYLFFDFLFKPLMTFGPLWAILGVSVIVSFIFSLTYKLLIDQDKMKFIKSELENLREKMNKAKKNNKEKELKDLYTKSLAISNKQMMLTMKPMMVSMIFIFILLPWLKYAYPEVLFKMPFYLPMFGATIGWLGLYIIVSLPTTFIFRKLLGVE